MVGLVVSPDTFGYIYNLTTIVNLCNREYS